MSKIVASSCEALKYILLIEPIYYENWSFLKNILLSEIKTILKDKGK